jgi:hypothetical protein
MKIATQVYRDWSEGVINSLRADELPLNASPRGINSTLVSVAKGKAIVGKRRGASLLLPHALYEDNGTTLATFKSLFQLNYYNASTRQLDPFFFATTDSGQLYSIDEENETETEITDALFSSGTLNPIWAQLNNVGYVTDGNQQKKVVIISGTPTVQKHGIVAPTKATSSAVSDGDFFAEAIAGGAMSASTWDVAVTFYNSNTGHESNLSSSFTLTVGATQQIRVYWDTSPADTQVTHIRVYMRKSGTMTEYARLTAWNFAIGAGSPQLFGTAADIDTTLLLTFAPDTGSNNVPPSTIKGWVVHNSRLFGWDEQNIYWSDITEIGPEPESFRTEAYLPVAPNDGSSITACHRIDDNVLVIMKEGSMYGLYGTDPNSWELRLIDPSVGCIAPKSLVTIEGNSYWWSRSGPIQWNHQEAPNQIGYQLLAETTSPENIYYQNAYNILAAADPPRQKVLFAFPTFDSPDENNVLIAFNYQLGVWETSKWDAFDICSMVLANDFNGRQYVYMGGCHGKLFKWWTADVDGIRLALDQRNASSVVQGGSQLTITVGAGHDYHVGQWIKLYGFTNIDDAPHPLEGTPLLIDSTTATEIVVDFTGSYSSYAGSGWLVLCDFTLSGQVISSTSTTLTVASGTNLDKEEMLIGQYLYSYLPGSGTYQRRRIVGVSNLALEFDVATPWAIEPDSNYLWVLSGPFFEWDTKWDDYDTPFMQKRFMFVYMDAICDTGTTDVLLDVYTGGSLSTVQRNYTLSISGTGAVFDESVFDSSVFAAESVSRLKSRIARVEYTYRYRVRHYDNNRQLVILRLGNDAHILTERRT